jgi:hypothetical protein
MADAGLIKEKIMALIQAHGPSLPVFIANRTGLSIIFASAFLSELIADKRLKISHMRIGSSPLYFITGQEPQLENYSNYLKNKEKDAFILIKERRFLKDKDLEPAIRVALRVIRDFAVPFKRNEEIYWRYFLVGELEFQESPKEEVRPIVKEPEEKVIEIIEIKPKEKNPIAEKEVILEVKEESKREEEIEKKKEVKEPKESKETKKHPKKKQETKKKVSAKEKKNNNFFSRIKEFLSQRQIEILGIEEISVVKIIFRVKKEDEYLIIAYNKKKITENDLVNSSKKAEEMNLPYQILLLGEPLKRFDNLIKAVKNLRNIEKVE